RPRLAGDEYRRIARRDARDHLEDRLERRVLRLDLHRAADALELGLEQDVLAREATLLPRATHEHVDLGHPVRFGLVVVRAELHGTDRRLDGAVARDDDDLRR